MKPTKRKYITDTPVLYVLAHTRAQLLRSVRDAARMVRTSQTPYGQQMARGEKHVAECALATLDGVARIMKPADRKTLFAESSRIYRDGVRVTLKWRAVNAPSLLTPAEAARAASYIAEDEQKKAA